jgi:hypothetical protein
MDKENVVYIHNEIVFGHKDQNYVICRKMYGTRDHHVKQNKQDSERQILHVFSHMQNLDFKKERDMKVEGGLFGKRK